MTRWLIPLAALAVASCGPKRVEIRTVRVLTPVAVPCIDPKDVKPLPQKPVGRLPDDPVAALAIAVGWLDDLWPWAVEYEGRVKGCSELK